MDDMRRGHTDDVMEDDELKEELDKMEMFRKAVKPAKPVDPPSELELTDTRQAPQRAAPEVKIPPALAKLFGTEAEAELMAVANLLDPSKSRGITMIFHTTVGDVKCPVKWVNTDLHGIARSEDLLLVIVRSSESMFVPTPGAELPVSFVREDGAKSGELMVTNLSHPMRLYPGVGIDLMCFLPHTSQVEKNGKVPDGVSPDRFEEGAEDEAPKTKKEAAVVWVGEEDDQPEVESFDHPRQP